MKVKTMYHIDDFIYVLYILYILLGNTLVRYKNEKKIINNCLQIETIKISTYKRKTTHYESKKWKKGITNINYK